MNKKIDFIFKFKGKRTYIHGTDLFNASIDFLRNEKFQNYSKIDVSFHKVVRKQMSGFFLSEKEFSLDYACSYLFSFYQNNSKFYICLKENESDVIGRYDYPEEKIVNISSFNGTDKSITLNKPISFSVIEKIVALNKSLLENIFPKVDGKWYFTRLQLEKNINDIEFKELKVQLIRNLNFKLTKSIIYIDNVKIGYIYFSLN